VMSRWPHRDERVPCRAFHYRIDRLARRARSTQGGLERVTRNQGVVIKITSTVADCFFNVFEVLRRVARLNVASTRFAGLDLHDVGP